MVLFVFGCSKNPLGMPGTLSFYSGKIGNINSSPALRKSSSWIIPDEAYIYVKSIDVSSNGESWINVFTGPAEVKVTQSGTIKIGSTIDLPEDEYHGIRIVIEPKVRIISGVNEVLLEKLPRSMGLGLISGFASLITPSDTITITSANGFLIPFTIKRRNETFIVFDIDIQYVDTADWDFFLYVRATQYLG